MSEGMGAAADGGSSPSTPTFEAVDKESGGEPEDVYFSGPPEPLVGDSDRDVSVFIPDGEADTRPGEPGHEIVTLGHWECQRCGDDVELGLNADAELQEPEVCRGCERQGPFSHVGGLDSDQLEVALQARTEWNANTAVSDGHILDGEGRSDLWDDVRDYISRYWKAKDGTDYDMLTAWVLATWFRENQRATTHLMTHGKTTNGKTRLLNTLSRLCYRGLVTGSATPASMFRHIHEYNMTYFISEYHGISPDAQRELDNIVRLGQKRGEKVTRSEQNPGGGYVPKTFDPFSNVAIASQFNVADDIANRCIQISARKADGRVPDLPLAEMDNVSEEIRNKLLFERLALHHSSEWQEAKREAEEYLFENDIVHRTREKTRSLMTVAILFDHKEEIKPVVERMVEDDRDSRRWSTESTFCRAVQQIALRDLSHTGEVSNPDAWGDVSILYKDIVTLYNRMTGEDRDSNWVGQLVDRLGFEKARHSEGMVVTDDKLHAKLEEQAEQFGWDLYENLESDDYLREMLDEDAYDGTCDNCENYKRLRYENPASGLEICASCAADEYGALKPTEESDADTEGVED